MHEGTKLYVSTIRTLNEVFPSVHLYPTGQGEVIGKRHYGRKALPAGGDGGRNPTRELFDTLLLWRANVPQLYVDVDRDTAERLAMEGAARGMRTAVAMRPFQQAPTRQSSH